MSGYCPAWKNNFDNLPDTPHCEQFKDKPKIPYLICEQCVYSGDCWSKRRRGHGAGGVDTDGSVSRSIRDAGKTKAGSPPSLPPQPAADSNNAGVGGNAKPAPDDLAQSAPQLVAKTLGNRGADESRVVGRAQREKQKRRWDEW